MSIEQPGGRRRSAGAAPRAESACRAEPATRAEPARPADAGEVATLEQLREIVRLAPIGVGIVDREGRAGLTNEALSSMLGFTPEEFARLSFEAFTHPDDIAQNVELFDEMMAGKRDGFELDKRFIHSEGHIVWGRLRVSLLRDSNGEPAYAIGLLQDITEETRLREELERLAFHDPLTDLANRRLFKDRVEHHLQRARRDDEQPGAVLFADLDDFKTLNDTLGHEAGDDVLRAVAQRIVGSLRPSDTASRLGGDEFAVLLEDVADVEAAVNVAQRLRARICEPVQIVDRMITTGVSIGITLLSAQHDADRALREADLAMYRAKEGDARIAAFTPELFEAALRELERNAFGDRTLRVVPGEATGNG